ncbi:MAG: hypothetical protein WAV82_03445 [Methylobacter sp.]
MNIVIRNSRERRIRHCRIQAPAVPGNAIPDCAAKIVQAVLADAIDGVRRNVRRVNYSKRRIERQPSGKRRGVRSGRMAGHAVACSGQIGSPA